MSSLNPKPLNLERGFKSHARTGMSEARGLICLAGKDRLTYLTAKPSGTRAARRIWTVTAYHRPPGAVERLQFTAVAPDAIRWEAAQLALMGLEIELEKDIAERERILEIETMQEMETIA